MDTAPHPVAFDFELESVIVPLADISPIYPAAPKAKRSAKYAQIAASLQEFGGIEPVLVTREPNGKYLVEDGHLRVEAAKDLGLEKIECLVAKEYDGWTANWHVSHVATIQQHRMIVKAMELGVPEADIARAFRIDVRTLRGKSQMLTGICAEVIERLKDKQVPINTFHTLRKMSEYRQIEAADLMVAMGTYTNALALSLLASTPEAQLVPCERPKKVKGLTDEQISLMERESASLDREYRILNQSYGQDHLDLVLAIGYVRKLISNPRVAKYLRQWHGELLEQFESIVEGESKTH